LGANTMVEFTFEEAIKLLSNNYETAKTNCQTFDEDLIYIKD